MSSKLSINVTARDSEILSALLRSPLDTQQLLEFSQNFQQPFSTDRLLRRRLSLLANAGFISSFQYAMMGGIQYYKPTKQGYRLIEGADAPLPPRSYFQPVSLSLQEHTRALADFLVKTYSNARKQGIEIGGFYRENQLRLTLGKNILQPDCAFQLLLPDGKTFNYLIEIDCGSEPLRSTKQRETLQQKIEFYDRYQDSIDARFRVLVLFTKRSARLRHFLELADDTIRDPQRTLLAAGLLADYLQPGDTLQETLFLDRSEQKVAVVPSPTVAKQALSVPRKETVFLDG